MGDQLLSGPSKSNSIISEETKVGLKRGWGLHGLSFDNIPNCDVNDSLFAISKGLSKNDITSTI